MKAKFEKKINTLENKTHKAIMREFKTALDDVLARVDTLAIFRKDLDDHFDIIDDLVDLYGRKLNNSNILQIFDDSISSAYQTGMKSTVEEIDVEFAFDGRDSGFFRFMGRAGKRIFNNFFATASNKLHTILTTSLSAGENWQQVKRNIRDMMGYTDRRAETIVRTEIARGVIASRVNQYKKADHVIFLEWAAAAESRCSGVPSTGKTCQEMDGVRYLKTKAAGLIPAHPNCTRKDTEVLTKNGWETVDELKARDVFLSLNPLTHKTEWVKGKHVTGGFYNRLFRFHNEYVDIEVTPNHRMYVNYPNQEEWQFVEASEINGPCFILTGKELTKVFVEKPEKVDYYDYTYCVELERNHILFVRYKGKTAFIGNCRCDWLPISQTQLKAEKREADKLKTEPKPKPVKTVEEKQRELIDSGLVLDASAKTHKKVFQDQILKYPPKVRDNVLKMLEEERLVIVVDSHEESKALYNAVGTGKEMSDTVAGWFCSEITEDMKKILEKKRKGIVKKDQSIMLVNNTRANGGRRWTAEVMDTFNHEMGHNLDYKKKNRPWTEPILGASKWQKLFERAKADRYVPGYTDKQHKKRLIASTLTNNYGYKDAQEFYAELFKNWVMFGKDVKTNMDKFDPELFKMLKYRAEGNEGGNDIVEYY